MRSEKTRAALQEWLQVWSDAPDAQTLADFLGIELAEPEPEPEIPVGQRRRSPSGVEVVRTGYGSTSPWRKYQSRGFSPDFWFTDAEVADWEVITDAPECDREHLPDGHVSIDLSGWADDDLRVAARGELGASLRAELARRGEL